MGVIRYQYKIKKETSNNLTGDAFSLTVPRKIVELFPNTKFQVTVTKTAIIYTSGIDLSQLKKEAQRINFSEIN